MKDAFHGSAYPIHGLGETNTSPHPTIARPYRGSSPDTRRRGIARTAPTWIQRALGGHGYSRLPRITLDIEVPWGSVPCWSGGARRWAHQTVSTAYQLRYDSHVRPAMPHNPVSVRTLVAVAEARADYADHRTGRNCRPTNERLAERTGLSVRTVQRASTALRLLGVATEVLRGRQRTRVERYASWRSGDRGRGWASVWALHDSSIQTLSPHPGGGRFINKTSSKKVVTTQTRRKSTAGRSGAERRSSPDNRALALANAWVHDQHSPPWARRYRTGTPWAAVLRGPAAHGWTPRDINQLITDWAGTGHWVPATPHRPIGLLGGMLAAHGNLQERPAALDIARERDELEQARQRVARQLAERDAHQRAREAGRAALTGPGRQAARRALAEVSERLRRRGSAGGLR
jgi:hypothetical protein